MTNKLEKYSQTVYFRCRPVNLFDALTDARAIQTYTQAPATINKDDNTFQFFGDSIQGKFTVLDKPSHIVQQWRQKTWPADVYSTVDIKISEVSDGVVRVELNHTGIPHDDAYGM